MRQEKVLLVMTLVARHSACWAHDIVTTMPINDGEVSEESIRRYAKEIMDALAILTDPDRAQWICPPPNTDEKRV